MYIHSVFFVTLTFTWKLKNALGELYLYESQEHMQHLATSVSDGTADPSVFEVNMTSCVVVCLFSLKKLY